MARAFEAPAELSVYWADATQGAHLAALLDGAEHERLSALQSTSLRHQFVSAHALTRLALAECTGLDATQLSFRARCQVCGGPHGKPELSVDGPRPYFSLAHSAGRVVVVTSFAGPVGIDVEAIGNTGFAGFDDLALTDHERRSLHALPSSDQARNRATYWTRKEAVLKATGAGLAVSPLELVVSAPTDPARLLEWTCPRTPRPAVHLTDLDVGTEHAACVAVIATEEVALSVRPADAWLAAWAPGARTATR